MIVEFQNVSKKYKLYHHLHGGIKNFLVNLGKGVLTHDEFIALHDINFVITKGETVGFIGKNGAGKSTILSLVAGVEKPTNGKVITRGRIASLLELGGGFHPDLTGRENIILNAVLLGLTRKEAKQALDAIIEFSELGMFIDEPIRVYSSGMLARLGFSVITQVKPDILIVDEVLAVGDQDFQKKCLQVMHNFKAQGVTILLVSHNPHDIYALCDRAIWIENHRVKLDATTDVVMPSYLGS